MKQNNNTTARQRVLAGVLEGRASEQSRRTTLDSRQGTCGARRYSPHDAAISSHAGQDSEPHVWLRCNGGAYSRREGVGEVARAEGKVTPDGLAFWWW